jgi:DNA-binding NarL/FixJ family response regulator
MEPQLKVILVDDNENFRNSLKEILFYRYNIQIIGEASNAKEFWELKNKSAADLILMDIMIPEVDGISIAKKLLLENHTIKIIAITMHTDKVYLDKLIEAGFVGCIFKNDLFNQLKPALDAVIHGERFYPDNLLLSNTKTNW